MRLATAQTPEEFRVCMVDIEQELRAKGERSAIGIAVVERKKHT